VPLEQPDLMRTFDNEWIFHAWSEWRRPLPVATRDSESSHGRERRSAGGKRPGLFDAASLGTRDRSEFGLLDLPVFVTAVVIPIVYRMGVVLGKYEKFKDAPAPIRA
jgi:hypothetical protein